MDQLEDTLKQQCSGTDYSTFTEIESPACSSASTKLGDTISIKSLGSMTDDKSKLTKSRTSASLKEFWTDTHSTDSTDTNESGAHSGKFCYISLETRSISIFFFHTICFSHKLFWVFVTSSPAKLTFFFWVAEVQNNVNQGIVLQLRGQRPRI